MNLHEDIIRIKEMMGLITEAENFVSNLKVGSNNEEEVRLLQNLLKIDETGEFNDETDECVREFQTFSEIKIDGVVGPETRGKLQDLIDGNLKGWLGCKKTPLPKSDSFSLLGGSDDTSNKSGIVPSENIVGSGWKSCKAWSSSGKGKHGDKFKVVKNKTGFMIGYNGPASGLSIAHAGNGGDTIHQVYNVLICEINPFLAQGGLKPNIDGIRFETSQKRGSSQLNIYVPITSGKGVWQLDRRGGWGHDPGPGKMEQKCSKLNKQGKECIGPVEKIATGPYGKITEYFVTHQI
jgi:hypothetical protein